MFIYLYFAIGIIFGIITLLYISYMYDYKKTKTLLMYVLPNIILWPIVVIIFISVFIMSYTSMKKKVNNYYQFLDDICKQVENEERD